MHLSSDFSPSTGVHPRSSLVVDILEGLDGTFFVCLFSRTVRAFASLPPMRAEYALTSKRATPSWAGTGVCKSPPPGARSDLEALGDFARY